MLPGSLSRRGDAMMALKFTETRREAFLSAPADTGIVTSPAWPA
jgi:hypothetical protein